jgi:peptidoglycan-associated lipoprotein
MRTTLGILAVVAAPALADPAPRAPDFSDAPSQRIDNPGRSFAASSGDRVILPSDDVGFDFDSAALPADAEATIGLAAHWLELHPPAYLFVVAHADPVGSAAYNDELSVRRGRAVRDYLMSMGIATSRVVTVACGARGHATRRADLITSVDRDRVLPTCD